MTDAPTVCANLPFILINEWKNKHVYYLSILIYFTNPDYYQSWLVARFMWPQNSFHLASVNFINTAVLLDHIPIWLLLCFNQYILVFTVLGLLPSPCTNHTHKFQPNCCAQRFLQILVYYAPIWNFFFSNHNFTLRKWFWNHSIICKQCSSDWWTSIPFLLLRNRFTKMLSLLFLTC